ncbi:MAG TPA: DoxX family protein [Amycolatopsis sp.]|nr:DoxX family protein [Amycolatopsis sp.]
MVEDSGYYEAQDGNSALDEPVDRLAYDDTPVTQWHGGLDFGLLVLRIVLGATLGVHGLQKVFGLFDGSGIDAFARILGDHGYTSQTTTLAWVGGVTEIGGGALLILGLLTPVAASALLAVAANAAYLTYGAGFFPQSVKGFDYYVVLAGIAFALLFTGPGRVSIDVNTPWRRRPAPFGLAFLILAAGAVAVLATAFR